MHSLIQQTLSHCGYDSQPTEHNLAQCFLDYVDTGAFSDLTGEEAADMIAEGELTIDDMCRALLNLNHC